MKGLGLAGGDGGYKDILEVSDCFFVAFRSHRLQVPKGRSIEIPGIPGARPFPGFFETTIGFLSLSLFHC